jgi:hypothetical protein
MFSEALKQVIRDAGMCTAPSFYSGRGATPTDLNDDILEKLYQGIEGNPEFPDCAAEGFLDLVENLPKMSATDFLIALDALAFDDWVWKNEVEHLDGTSIPPDRGNGVHEAIAFCTIASQAFNRVDQSWMIRNDFLQRHGRKPQGGPLMAFEEFCG